MTRYGVTRLRRASNSITPRLMTVVLMRSRLLFLLAIVLCLPVGHAADLTPSPVQVSTGVYAVIGDLGPQTYENEGVNVKLGFVITDSGVVVIDAGPSVRVASALHAAIRRITRIPVAYVINTNSQNHRWLGNAYFASMDVPIFAHRAAIRLMKEQAADQIRTVRDVLLERFTGTAPAMPTHALDESHTLYSTMVNFALLARRNVHQVYTALELE